MNPGRAEPTPSPQSRCRHHKPDDVPVRSGKSCLRPPGVYQESRSQNKEYTEAIANGKMLNCNDQTSI